MYGNRQKKRIYSVLVILLIAQLCFVMSGIFSEKVYSDESDIVNLNFDEAIDEKGNEIDIESGLEDDITVAEYVYRVDPVNPIPIGELEEQTAIQGNGNGLTGEYNDNTNFKKLIFQRVDRQIDFDWGNGSPDPSIKKNTFSIRWTGMILPKYTAKHTIYLYADDGARLWINGDELIDFWSTHASKEETATIDLIAGQKYDIKVEYFNVNKEAKIALYWSSPYESKTIIPMEQLYTKPDTPSNVNITAEGSDITLSWDNTRGAEGYQLEVDGAMIDNITDIQYVHKVLPNTEHKYRIRAINEVSSGDWTQIFVKVSAPATPVNLSVVSTSTSIELTWDAVEAAAGYDVEVQGTSIDNGNNTTYIQNGLNPNTQRTYRIRAKNENGISDWSSIIAKSTLTSTPVNLSTTSTETSIKLLWDAVAGATGYDVEADGVVFESILLNEYSLYDLAPNTSHSLRVRAKNEDGSGDWSDLITAYTLLNEPIITAAEASDTSIKIAWTKLDEVMSYDIEADGLIIDIGKDNEFIHQNLLPNTEHIYRVRAKNESSISTWSEAVKKLTLPDAPKNLSTTTTSSSVGLAWDKVEGAIEYEVEANGIVIVAVVDNKYIHENLDPNTEHIYKVRAKSKAGTGNWSEKVKAFTLLGIPSNIQHTATSTAITLTWDEADGADAYDVEPMALYLKQDLGLDMNIWILCPIRSTYIESELKKLAMWENGANL